MKRAIYCLFVSAIIGCTGSSGPELGKVTGTVKVAGVATPNVLVVFEPVEGGRVSSARSDKSGNYKLTYTRDRDGAVLGLHNVKMMPILEAVEEEGEIIDFVGNAEQMALEEPPSFEKNDVEVKSGSNTIDFDIPAGTFD
ncbi:hypothetical protein [Calycomorphotria hydatis]|uniref:Carboxypeptidase regulatory-like domain-containing protein n=1 Tax=Calycomorphotria hydatis TaxID=2528027 RepID=A0A517TDI2_9PLAN|nr:hypothetical protein [Calycomorphotria hydatis]QDT66440.1 hypothetical protein V22_37070 [Calycomorphotria hydatis]